MSVDQTLVQQFKVLLKPYIPIVIHYINEEFLDSEVIEMEKMKERLTLLLLQPLINLLLLQLWNLLTIS